MPRPPLEVGTWGEIWTYVAKTDDGGNPIRYRAVTRYRDYDGRTRHVERFGATEKKAVAALRKALKERARAAVAGDLNSGNRFSDAATLWLERIERAAKADQRSLGTVETYRRQLTNHVLPGLGELRLREITTGRLDRFLNTIKDDIGAPTAKTCRSAVSGVLGLAVRYGALTHNPIRDVEVIETKAKKEPRALTAAERVQWIAQLEDDEDAVNKDLPDLSRFMMATGLRIGEALAVLWSEVDSDMTSVDITSTVIRVTGVGLIRKRTKSRAGERRLALPSWATEMLERRKHSNPEPDSPVFPDSLGGLRDPSNTRRALREARGTEGFEWVTSHNFRKTAATIMDDAGLSARAIADQLGHARPSMTQDVYLGRKINGTAAAAALEGMWDTDSEQSVG